MSAFQKSVMFVWLVCGVANYATVSGRLKACSTPEVAVVGSSLLAAALGPTFTLAVLMRGPLKGCPTTKATA